MDQEDKLERVGELYVLLETLVRCVVQIESVGMASDQVELEVRVVPSELHGGRCTPQVGETLSLSYARGMRGVAFRLVPLEEYRLTRSPV